ncbi:large-conductance mechanosensitive channel [Gorgonomyces haynaldii]|nr:large-conductance mechanosensitive channel [Gorgonomyces haynaldii]
MSRTDSPTRDQFLELGPNESQHATEESALLEYVGDVLEDVQDTIEDGAQIAGKGLSMFWSDFSDFIDKGNVLELGIGFMLGNSFGSLSNSFVTDILSPPFSFFTKRGKAMENWFIVLHPGASGKYSYFTLQDAIEDGATTENFGLFLQKTIDFLITAFVLFWIIKAYQAFKNSLKKPVIHVQTKKQCNYCMESIHMDATRCPHCTSELSEQKRDVVVVKAKK